MVTQKDLNRMIGYETLWFATASALLGMIFRFATVNIAVKDKIEVSLTLLFPLVMIVFLAISKHFEKLRASYNFDIYYSIAAVALLVVWGATIGSLWENNFFNNADFLLLGSFYALISLVIHIKVTFDIL